MYFQNVSGVRTKLTELLKTIACCDYDIIILVESNLNDCFGEGEVKCDGFSSYRCDRNFHTSRKKSGGGVWVLVSDKISSQRINIRVNRVEQLFLLCQINNTQFLLGAVYIPPQSPKDLYEWHCETVEEVCQRYKGNNIFVFGDYNLPDALWSNDEFGALVQCCNGSPAIGVAQAFGYLNLFQHNQVPNDRNVYLDLVFSNVSSLEVLKARDILLESSLHHIAYECALPIVSRPGTANLSYTDFYYDFRSGNYRDLNIFLASIEWERCLNGSDINLATGLFYELISTGIALYIPVKRYKTSSFPKWFSPMLRNLTLQKKTAHLQFIQDHSDESYIRFSALRAECKRVSDFCFSQYMRGIDVSLRNNPRSFWKYINDKRANHDLPGCLYYGSSRASNGQDIANLFREFFQTVYSTNSIADDEGDSRSYNNIDINCTMISKMDIFTQINRLPPLLTAGPDGIPNFFLKECICTITLPLFILFSGSLRTSVFPDAWKESYVRPVFKSGQKDLIENYRSVSLQSAIPKLFDSLVTGQLSWLCRGLLDEEQHGFSRNRSTVTNLVCYQNDILLNMEGRRQVDSVYTDFSKAFDRVDHHILYQKLSKFGFNDRLIQWFQSFLSDRVQRVKVGCFLSDTITITSGVPQGGHCSPLLFNIFVRDISGCFLNSKCLKFADDLKFWRAVDCIRDQHLLQADIDRLSDWCIANNLFLNVKKCCFISFYRKPDRHKSNYYINGEPLRCVSSVKDLGVLFDERLSFVEHIHEVSMKASRMLGFVVRNCRYFSTDAIRMVYCSLVRSCLEFSSVVWSPYFQNHIEHLERTQHKFLKVCAYREGMHILDHDYTFMEQHLSLPSLKHRRDFLGASFIFKVVNGMVDCPELLSVVGFNVPNYLALRHKNTFRVSFHRTTYAMYNPLDRYMSLLNGVNVDVFYSSLRQLKECML